MADDEEYISCSSAEEEEPVARGIRSAPAGRNLRPYIWKQAWSGTDFISKRTKRVLRNRFPDTPPRNPDVGKSKPKRRIDFRDVEVNAPLKGKSTSKKTSIGKRSAERVSGLYHIEDNPVPTRILSRKLPFNPLYSVEVTPPSVADMATKEPTAEGRQRQALRAMEALGEKEAWETMVLSKFEEQADIARLSKWLTRAHQITALVLKEKKENLGSAGGTLQDGLRRLVRDQEPEKFFSSNQLIQDITSARELFNDIWKTPNDVSNEARTFKTHMYSALAQMQNFQEAYSAFARLDHSWAEKNQADELTTPEINEFMLSWQGVIADMKRLIENVVDERPFAPVRAIKTEPKESTGTEVEEIPRVAPPWVEPQKPSSGGEPSKSELFKMQVAASVSRAPQGGAEGGAVKVKQEGQPEQKAPPPPAPGAGGNKGRANAGNGQPPDDGGDVFCVLCFSNGHTARQCPNAPTDGKGPYCIKCSRRGHTIFRCPYGRFDPPPCPHCGDVGHYADQCPLKKIKDKVEKANQARTMEEMRLLQKAGLSLSSDDEEDDSDVQHIPRETPKQAMRRQLKEKREIERQRQIKKVQREEEKFFDAQWADLHRLRQDIILLISGRRENNIDNLTENQREEVNKAMVNAYLQQVVKGPRFGGGEPTTASSLKELGIDGLQPYSGDESKLPVKSFIRNVDEVKGFKKWSNPVATIAMGKLLIEAAREWYEVFKADRNQEPPEYHELKLGLIKQFYRKITVVEKAKVMASLKFDVTKHRGHLAFLTECERKSHLICDKGFMVENGSELITRNQAREEMVLMHFLAGASPNIRYEVSHSGAETKAEVKEAILRVEEALRAKESEPRHALLPGYQANEITWTEDSLSSEMKKLGYDDLEINAVVRSKGLPGRGRRPNQKGASSPEKVIQCHYCATIGHKRSECDLLTEHYKKGTVHPDKCGPKEGLPVNVNTLSKRFKKDQKKKDDAAGKVRKKKKKVNEIEADGSSSEEEVTAPPKAVQPIVQQVPVPVPWGPWGPQYPQGRYPALAPPASHSSTQENLQASEITLKSGPHPSPYDFI